MTSTPGLRKPAGFVPFLGTPSVNEFPLGGRMPHPRCYPDGYIGASSSVRVLIMDSYVFQTVSAK
jgi:hypothetical protein